MVGGVAHNPGVAEHATEVFVKPATAGSLKTARVTSLGPLLVARMVYVVVPPALTLATPSVFVTAISTTEFTGSVSLAVLFPGVGSVVPDGGVIVAVFVTLPLKLV